MPAHQGPCRDLWKSAVVDDRSLPPLQPHEHMTVGQVRHLDLKQVFKSEFQKWFSQTKTEVNKAYKQHLAKAKKRGGGTKRGGRPKRGRGRGTTSKAAQEIYDDDASAQAWLIVCAESADANQVPLEVRQTVEDQVAALLGWDRITCKQLRQLLDTYDSERALQQLLHNSYRRRQEQQRRQHVADADAADGSGPLDEAEADCGDDCIADTDSELDSDDLQDEHAWFTLKTDIPVIKSVRSGVVPETDERKPLRGANGIWATEDVPAGSVLGPYRHYCMFNNSYHKLLETPRKGWKGTPSTWRLQLESYACNDDAAALEDTKSGSSYSFVYSGWGYGNYTGYANDPHVDPIGSLFAEGKPDDYLGPCVKDDEGQELEGNTLCVVVKILGWPYLFMITTKPVRKDRELTYKYGHGYWVLVAKALKEAQAELQTAELLKEHEAMQKKLDEMRCHIESQLTSGLTTSLQSLSASVAAPTASVAGTAAVTSPARGNKPAAAVSGLTSIGHGLQGMQLISGALQQQQQQQQQRAGVLQVRLPDHQQQRAGVSHLQLHDHQQQEPEGVGESPAGSKVLNQLVPAATYHGSELQASAAGGPSLAAAYDELADLEDEASSAFPRALFAYRDQPLFHSKQQEKRLKDNVDKVRRQQLMMEVQGRDGVKRQMKRINEPGIAKDIRDAEMKLSRILFKYSAGVSFKKLSTSWWIDALAQYEYDQWEFIRRRPLFFECIGHLNSPNTVIQLTAEWRDELQPIAKHERWQRPSNQFSGRVGHKRVRQEVVVVKDPQLQEELQQKRQRLQAAEDEQQQLVQRVQELQALLQHLQPFLQQARLPPQLHHRLQDALKPHQHTQTAAAPAAEVTQAAVRHSDCSAFRGAPVPGMFGGAGDSDADDSGYEDEPEQQEPSDDAEGSEGNVGVVAAARPVGLGPGVPAVGGGSNSRGDVSQPRSQLQAPKAIGQRPMLQQHHSRGGQYGAQHGSRSGDGQCGHNQQAGYQQQGGGGSQARQTSSSIGQRYDHQQQSGHYEGVRGHQQLGWAEQQQAGHQHMQQQPLGRGGRHGSSNTWAGTSGQENPIPGRQQQWAYGNRQQGTAQCRDAWQQQSPTLHQPAQQRSGSYGRSYNSHHRR